MSSHQWQQLSAIRDPLKMNEYQKVSEQDELVGEQTECGETLRDNVEKLFVFVQVQLHSTTHTGSDLLTF